MTPTDDIYDLLLRTFIIVTSLRSQAGLYPFPKAFFHQRFFLEESQQWLENVDRTHLVPASGKLVLQKEFVFPV